MSITINHSVIASVVNSAVKGMDVEASDGESIASQAVSDLAAAINSAIAGSLSGAEAGSVGSASVGSVSKSGKNQYTVGIDIPAQSRSSLLPEKYDGVTDMAALFNNGYVARQIVLFDKYRNFIGASRPVRSPAQFVQSGVAAFMGSGGSNYKIISIDIDGRFT